MKKIRSDMAEIEASPKVFAFADKTSNIYKMEASFYNKLLLESVTSTYKKADDKAIESINNEALKLIQQRKIEGKKIPKMEENPAFISIKDHKKDFPTKISCRLINPSKTFMAKISKTILDAANQVIRKKSNLKQWRSTGEVLDWFESIDDKNNKCFIKFDIQNFYPCISRRVLGQALAFARTYTEITEEDEDVILHACRTILTHDNLHWKKKSSEDDFDVPMGSFHGAELCELVGLFLLDKLRRLASSIEYGIYRDDGLAVAKKSARTNLERIAKQIKEVFGEYGFKITIEVGMAVTDFLDVKFDLPNESYEPYRKPNSEATYVDSRSNHPNYILKQIPKTVNSRLEALSKDERVFLKNKSFYQTALKNSNHNHELTYSKVTDKALQKRRRKRKAMYLQPPFCNSVVTKIGSEFLRLVTKHFTKDHPYSKILNRRSIKISYCCMANVKTRIMAHNRKILNNLKKENDKKNV